MNITPIESSEPDQRNLFPRTVCVCDGCRGHCKTLPGHLIPGDPERIARFLSQTVDQIETLLLASPGAIVGNQSTGHVFRIPTLVPARRPDGKTCVFLTDDERCSIHPVAPYGCSHFDDHMSGEEGDCRSLAGLRAIASDQAYLDRWRRLWEAERRAPGPEHGGKLR